MDSVYWVLDQQLAGRPGPRRRPWNPAQLFAGGLRTIVTLTLTEGVGNLARFGLRQLRVHYTPLPFMPPGHQWWVARRAERLLDFIHAELAAGRPTLVHCHDGDDRTGIVLAGYFVRYYGLSSQAAIDYVRSIRPTAMKMPGYACAVHYIRPK